MSEKFSLNDFLKLIWKEVRILVTHADGRFTLAVYLKADSVSPLHTLVSGSEVEVLVAEGRGPGDVPEHGEGVGGVGAGPRQPPGQTHRGEVRGEVVGRHLQLALRLRHLSEDGAGRLGPSSILKVAGEEREAPTSKKLLSIYL